MRRPWPKFICFLLFLCGVVIPVVLFILTNGYYDLEKISSASAASSVRGFETGSFYSAHERKPLDFSEVRLNNREDVQYQLEELQQIVVSVRNELRHLEQDRTQVRKELDMGRNTLTRIRKEISATKAELQDSKGKLAKTLREMKRTGQYSDQANPAKSPVVVVNLPHSTEGRQHDQMPRRYNSSPDLTTSSCFDAICFDYSRCPVTKDFGVYIYNAHQNDLFDLKYPEVVEDLVSSLRLKQSLVSDPSEACIFVVIVGPLKVQLDARSLEQTLTSLPSWRNGSNHLIIDLAYRGESMNGGLLNHAALGRSVKVKGYAAAMEASSFNVLLPPVTRDNRDAGPTWHGLPLFLPALRKTFLHFEGGNTLTDEGILTIKSHLIALKEAISSHSRDQVEISTECTRDGARPKAQSIDNVFGEWTLCGTPQQRAANLSQATFSLILGSGSGTTGPMTYTRLIESLRYGAIPVVLGIRHLPFDSVINWGKAAVVLSFSNLGQLHYILKNIRAESILKYRRQGRFLWDTYFSSPTSIMDAVIAIVRQRALHPPPGATDYVAPNTIASIPGENRMLFSQRFSNNFTSYGEEFWNSPPGPFYMYPLTPFKPGPVSGSQYVNLDQKQILNLPHHVVAAGGITGPFFEDYLLGNVPEEQFTIVLLTYERNQVLLDALERLRDLYHLAKVVVVWNSLKSPPSSLKWPEIGVPIDVVSVGRNSLNNRFLPFSNIQTEAVLSVDDDVHLRHDEIQFAFRVWREARDRVVGFPGRFHAWDTRHSGWLYNSNYTCELSMVLTGAAFFHKYYMHLYSQWLFSEARELVDQFLNCEDIAMNFLVSHITRKPPLKVTSRWTFRCPGCPEALSSNDEHFNERHVCMNRLVQMFGYMPLLYTQFRVDSVLFKTRLPSHLEKCYEFV